MKERHRKVRLAESLSADFVTYVKHEECPECGADIGHIETVLDEEAYVDDEAMYLTQYGPKYLPYKDWQCGQCGAKIRVLLGTVAVDVIEGADIEV